MTTVILQEKLSLGSLTRPDPNQMLARGFQISDGEGSY